MGLIRKAGASTGNGFVGNVQSVLVEVRTNHGVRLPTYEWGSFSNKNASMSNGSYRADAFSPSPYNPQSSHIGFDISYMVVSSHIAV